MSRRAAVFACTAAAVALSAPVELAIPKTTPVSQINKAIAPLARYVASRNPNAPAAAIARAAVHSAGWHGLDPALVLAVMEIESFYNPKARGRAPIFERGLMQLRRETAREVGLDWARAYEVGLNVNAGTFYLAGRIKAHRGDLRSALARYNGTGQAAQAYAARVLRKYKEIRKAIGGA